MHLSRSEYRDSVVARLRVAHVTGHGTPTQSHGHRRPTPGGHGHWHGVSLHPPAGREAPILLCILGQPCLNRSRFNFAAESCQLETRFQKKKLKKNEQIPLFFPLLA